MWGGGGEWGRDNRRWAVQRYFSEKNVSKSSALFPLFLLLLLLLLHILLFVTEEVLLAHAIIEHTHTQTYRGREIRNWRNSKLFPFLQLIPPSEIPKLLEFSLSLFSFSGPFQARRFSEILGAFQRCLVGFPY